MVETRPGRDAFWQRWSGVTASVLLHGMVVVAVLWVRNGAVELVPYRLPGTSVGLESLTYYSPGSAQMARSDIPAKTAKPKVSSAVHSAVAIAQPAAAAPSSEKGDGNAGQSGLGDGDITIALQKYFPYPNPSLAGLPRGASGDVILNAVIDEHGKIADLTLLQGLGEPIDDEVIQTVNQWVYTPAMKNGVPVASVQELHFHYERRG